MILKNYTVPIIIICSILCLPCCQSNADKYAADVYKVDQLNTRQETKTVNIISILPAKVSVDNKTNQRAAQIVGGLLGAVAGGVTGDHIGSGNTLGTVAGTITGGTIGAAAGSLVSNNVLVGGVSLTYKDGTKIYTSTQVGKTCQFTPGLAMVVSTKNNETRIQPNAKCPEK
ncbi:hypothetical protein COMNV_00567 [Commensalibacter sp. Nvir]|uniref:hypothetical protein n=1 Tax=Commensalibacter sp. Nvir TaxID=3069817 RepID=UPI002D3CA912|nr:hypothetical protein COMNV_00567 [Commensalibacter sp. Nvir]